jgi:hypothetical protein
MSDETLLKELLTLSSPVMPFGIILLILFLICYNFFGLEKFSPFQPQKLYHMKDRIKSMMSHGITELERVKERCNSSLDVMYDGTEVCSREARE